MIILGIDPGGAYTGLAVVAGQASRPTLLHLAAIRIGSDQFKSLRDGIACIGHPLDRVVAERVPKTARKDTGRSKVQAVIGSGTGYIAGLATAIAVLSNGTPGATSGRVEPSEWRPSMLAAAARAGKLIQPPRRAPGWGPDDVRDAWKAAACAFVAHAYPQPYKRLVDDARSRARTAKHDWELAGVPDACEAVGIAIHGLMVPLGPNALVEAAKASRARRAMGGRQKERRT